MNREFQRRIIRLESDASRRHGTHYAVSPCPVPDEAWLEDGSVDPLWQAPPEPDHHQRKERRFEPGVSALRHIKGDIHEEGHYRGCGRSRLYDISSDRGVVSAGHPHGAGRRPHRHASRPLGPP
jgi:hypothetical protein